MVDDSNLMIVQQQIPESRSGSPITTEKVWQRILTEQDLPINAR